MTITATTGQLSVPRLPLMETLFSGNLSHLLRRGCGHVGLPLPLLSVSRRKEAKNFTERDPRPLWSWRQGSFGEAFPEIQ